MYEDGDAPVPGGYTFVAADALVLKVREGRRVVNVHTLIDTGVNSDGHREILRLQVTFGRNERVRARSWAPHTTSADNASGRRRSLR